MEETTVFSVQEAYNIGYEDGRLVLRVQGEENLENLTFCPSFV